MFYSLVALQVTLNAYSDRLATPYQLSSVVQSGRRQESLSGPCLKATACLLCQTREKREIDQVFPGVTETPGHLQPGGSQHETLHIQQLQSDS